MGFVGYYVVFVWFADVMCLRSLMKCGVGCVLLFGVVFNVLFAC